MNDVATACWGKAHQAIETARADALRGDHDAGASRAYYAAFYGVTALFALEGQSFTKHTAIEAAVHRDLVKTGRWPTEAGHGFTALRRMRHTSDYDVKGRITAEEATEAIRLAESILQLVSTSCPQLTLPRQS